MTKLEYMRYLQTSHWKKFSANYKSHHPNCEACGIKRDAARFHYGQDLNVHHLEDRGAYQRLFEESWNDVQALCRRCHELTHFAHTDLPDWSVLAAALDPWARRN